MITRETFDRGMKLLCANWNRVPSMELLDAYLMTLGTLNDEQFQVAIRTALASTDAHMPTAGQLLAPFLAPARVGIEAEGSEAFERLLSGECSTYRPQGSYIAAASVERVLGQRAAEAFKVCGGDSAFSIVSERDRPFLLRRWQTAYGQSAATEPARATLGNGQGSALAVRQGSGSPSGQGRTHPEPASAPSGRPGAINRVSDLTRIGGKRS